MKNIELTVAEKKIHQFATKGAVDAVAELVWNALDANATTVAVVLQRSSWNAITDVIVTDNGDGISPDRATAAFGQYGDSWKAGRTYSDGDKRILHGSKGEGRLFTFALGNSIRWVSVSKANNQNVEIAIDVSSAHPKRWYIAEPIATTGDTGTTLAIEVPQTKTLSALDKETAGDELLARLAPYLLAYPDVTIEFDGKQLDVRAAIADIRDLELDLPEVYRSDDPPPLVTFVEWNSKRSGDGVLLACTADGVALADLKKSHNYSDSVVRFTPYLKSSRFRGANSEELHSLTMDHPELFDAADRAIRDHLAYRRALIASEVVEQLKEEGIYPYSEMAESDAQKVQRKTFDLVITVAREALPKQATPRRLSVSLIQAALEHDPNDLQRILSGVLALSTQERTDLARLLDRTELSNIISAATTVSARLDFIARLREIFADPTTRAAYREVDQLHPEVAKNLWMFGEDWSLARTEVGLTSVLRQHLHELGGNVALEHQLSSVKREDGRSGRVDILMFRGARSEERSERLIVELKRPSLKVGKKELEQIKSYARAIVEDPQYDGVECKWKFILVTYEVDQKILRDIRQQGKEPGLADDQEEYQVWVQTWGDIFDAAERRLSFFQRQLQLEAREGEMTEQLDTAYARLTTNAGQAKSA